MFSQSPAREYSYEALHDEALEFFNNYNISVLGSQEKLTLMHKRGTFTKLGKETIKGDISGTLTYHARIKGFGGDVKMIYKNYSDLPGMVITGESNVSAKMNMHGWMYGKIYITDSKKNPLAEIDYNSLEIVHGVDGGGGYYITLTGKAPVFLKWDEVNRPDREEEFYDEDGNPISK